MPPAKAPKSARTRNHRTREYLTPEEIEQTTTRYTQLALAANGFDKFFFKMILTQESLHRFSVPNYYRMGELGLLNERTELIEGIIIDIEPIGPWHASILDILNHLYRDHHPVAADIFLVIEVADTSLAFDLGQKRALYSGAGVPEYWIVDVKAKRLIRFVQEGKELVENPVSGSRISPATLPGVSIDLAELFG